MLQWTDIDFVYGLLHATQVTALHVQNLGPSI